MSEPQHPFPSGRVLQLSLLWMAQSRSVPLDGAQLCTLSNTPLEAAPLGTTIAQYGGVTPGAGTPSAPLPETPPGTCEQQGCGQPRQGTASHDRATSGHTLCSPSPGSRFLHSPPVLFLVPLEQQGQQGTQQLWGGTWMSPGFLAYTMLCKDLQQMCPWHSLLLLLLPPPAPSHAEPPTCKVPFLGHSLGSAPV